MVRRDWSLSVDGKAAQGGAEARARCNRRRGSHAQEGWHLWYDPSTMPTVAKALSAALSAVDAAHADNYATRLKAFLASLQPLNDKIAAIRGKYAGTFVAATERYLVTWQPRCI
jgi:ABC-type Zn uptake system ZnuABC Zn-binding protein ZnuA